MDVARPLLLTAALAASTLSAAETLPAGAAELPAVAIIIDDIGWNLREGLRALALPGPVAISILPHTPYATRLGMEAAARGKEVLMHQPLEAMQDNALLGPGALRMSMSRAELVATLLDNLDAVPWAIG